MIVVSGIIPVLYSTCMQCVRPLDLDIIGDENLRAELDIKIVASF